MGTLDKSQTLGLFGSVLICLCLLLAAVFIAVNQEVTYCGAVGAFAINDVALPKYVLVLQKSTNLQGKLTSQDHCQIFRTDSAPQWGEGNAEDLSSSYYQGHPSLGQSRPASFDTKTQLLDKLLSTRLTVIFDHYRDHRVTTEHPIGNQLYFFNVNVSGLGKMQGISRNFRLDCRLQS
jgi:hypothetical protein